MEKNNGESSFGPFKSKNQAETFFNLVKRMRNKQLVFFRTHDKSVLGEAKVLEQRVDLIIKDIDSPSLF